VATVRPCASGFIFLAISWIFFPSFVFVLAIIEIIADRNPPRSQTQKFFDPWLFFSETIRFYSFIICFFNERGGQQNLRDCCFCCWWWFVCLFRSCRGFLSDNLASWCFTSFCVPFGFFFSLLACWCFCCCCCCCCKIFIEMLIEQLSVDGANVRLAICIFQLIWEPIKTLVEAVATRGARRLYVPVTVA